MAKTKIDELSTLLKDLESIKPNIEASAVVSVEGLMENCCNSNSKQVKK